MEYHQPVTARNSFRKSSNIKRENKMQTYLMFIVDEFGKIQLEHDEGKLFKIIRLKVRYSKRNTVKAKMGLHT